MTNNNCLDGMKCPQCGSEEPFDIEVRTYIKMFDAGSDDIVSSIEWENGASCVCCSCSYSGFVSDFMIEKQ